MSHREYSRILFSGHAVRQMLSRNISKDDVVRVASSGEVIHDYPEDRPYPSRLMLGFLDELPIHVVCAIDQATNTGIIITAYIPDSKLWSDDFKTRRPEQ